MVGFDASRKMGEHATSGASSNFRNTVYAMKRLVGLPYDDPRAKAEMAQVAGVSFLPVPHSLGGPPSVGVSVTYNGESQVVPIEMVYGMMVRHMGHVAAQKAASTSGGSGSVDLYFPQDWVIAVPNYYTDAQRRAVLAGCEMVGITGGSVQRLMNESTATALAYGIFKDVKKEFTADKPTHVMFIDMGASAYTVSVVSFEPGKLIVKSVYCDPDLGGRDFDMAIAGWVSSEFEAKYKGKLSGKPLEKPKSRLKLLAACEKAKKTLSPQGVSLVQINVEMLLDDYDFQITLKADTYEKLCEPLLQRLAGPVESALAEAGLSAKDLASVEIVGGSTRIGCVKRKLQSILGCGLSTTMNADEAVARGAALQSAILSPRFKVLPYEIHEAQMYPIKVSWQDDAQASGMEVDGGDATPTDAVVMFERGMNFPVVRRVTLRRSGKFDVNVSYDESALRYGLASPVEICKFTISSVAEDRKVRVNVKQDIHGIISLSSAQMIEEIEEDGGATAEESTNKEGEDGGEKKVKKTIKKTNLEFKTSRPLELTKDEINKYHEVEVAMANNDRVVQETADKRNELESYIYDMRDKVSSDSQLGLYGTDQEKAAFSSKNEAMEEWLYGDGFDATKSVYAEKLTELKKLGQPMEARQAEALGRPAAISTLQANLEQYQKWVNDSQTEERYSHITDEEREKVRSLTDSTSSWMYDMLDKQGALSLNQDPVLSVAAIKAKSAELTMTCSPIMNKPMPPKPKEEPKKAADPPASSGATDVEKKNGSEDPIPDLDPMESDKASENGEKAMDVDP
jgi:heat shock protein 4